MKIRQQGERQFARCGIIEYLKKPENPVKLCRRKDDNHDEYFSAVRC